MYLDRRSLGGRVAVLKSKTKFRVNFVYGSSATIYVSVQRHCTGTVESSFRFNGPSLRFQCSVTAAQARKVFANLKVALAAAGATFHDVIKLNYYCTDSVDLSVHLPVVCEIRDTYVNTSAPPASTFVVVRRLVRPEWLIEVEAVAVVPHASR